MKRSSPTFLQNANRKQCFEPWHCKPALELDPVNDALIFRQTSIDWYMDQEQKPIIHIYGITNEGNSVLCHVHGFLPYTYFATLAEFTEDDLPHFEKCLSGHFKEDGSGPVRCEIVQRRSLYGYNEEATFVKVTLTNPYKLSKLGDATEERYYYCHFLTNKTYIQKKPTII